MNYLGREWKRKRYCEQFIPITWKENLHPLIRRNDTGYREKNLYPCISALLAVQS